MRCMIIPEKIVQEAFKAHKRQTGEDWTCVWRQEAEEGIYLQDFKNHIKLTHDESRSMLQKLLGSYGYDFAGVKAFYYTTSKFYIAVWRDE